MRMMFCCLKLFLNFLFRMASLVERARPILSSSSSRLFGDKSQAERIGVVIRLWDACGKKSLRDTQFTVKSSSPLKNILRIYSVREAINPLCLGYFKFMVGSRELSGEESAMEAGLSDGDYIDAIPCLEDVVGGRFV